MTEAKSNTRSGIYLNAMGATLISAGIVLSLFTGQDYAVFCALTGLMVTAVGFYFAAKYGKIHSGLTIEFEEIVAQIPRCSGCGKDLPEGDFWACPFCGKSQKSGNIVDHLHMVIENSESSLLA